MNKQKRLENIIRYFYTKTPESVHSGAIFTSAMEIIETTPELVPYFEDSQFFKIVHKGH